MHADGSGLLRQSAALKRWEERQEAVSGREGALEEQVQELEARLAAAEDSLQSYKNSKPSNSGVPRPPGLTKAEKPYEVGGQCQVSLPLIKPRQQKQSRVMGLAHH